MIELSHVSRITRDGRTVLNDISFHIGKGEVVSIIGASGSGKSSLLRCICGLDPITNGTVRLGGKVGVLQQHFNLFPHMTVLENVTLAPVLVGGMTKEDADALGMEMLRTVGLAGRANQYPQRLSGGEKQRAAIARCLAVKPDVILFDEPTSLLDQVSKGETEGVIKDLVNQGMTIVLSTHDLDFAREISTRVMFMYNGKKLEDGPADKVFDNPSHTLTKLFLKNLSSLDYEIEDSSYDLYNLASNISWYCKKKALSVKDSSVQLVTEEILTHFLPFTGPAHLRFFEDGGTLYLEIEQKNFAGPLIEGREGVDELSLTIIKGICSEITETPNGSDWITLLHFGKA